jgi:hypothetical protein
MRRVGAHRASAQRGVTTLEYIVLGAVLVLGLVAGVSAFRKQVDASAATEGEALLQVASGQIAPVRDRYGEGSGGPGAGGPPLAVAAEPENRVLHQGVGPDGAAAVSQAIAAVGDFVGKTRDYWRDYANEWRGFIDDAKQGLERAKPYQATIDRAREKVRNGQRLGIKERLVWGQYEKGRKEAEGRAKELLQKPLRDGAELWRSLPPGVKVLPSLL